MFDVAPLGRMDDQRAIRAVSDDQWCHTWVVLHLHEEGSVVGHQQELAAVAHKLEAAVARDIVEDVGADVVRQRVLAKTFQDVDRLSRAQPGSRCIPER